MITEISLPDIPLSASWNWDGSKLAATCKDKKIRLLDPRTGNVDKVITAFSYMYL